MLIIGVKIAKLQQKCTVTKLKIPEKLVLIKRGIQASQKTYIISILYCPINTVKL